MTIAPLKGLQSLGVLVFRWVAVFSVAITIGIAVSNHTYNVAFVTALVMKLQFVSYILALCLLLFVCFTIEPLGLSYRSRIFGIPLGMGITVAAQLVLTAWQAHTTDMGSVVTVVRGIVLCTSCTVWLVYFVLPEPKRRHISIPSTSPFLRWKQIAMALGDEPGYVMVASEAPFFAPAELEVMRRSVEWMKTKEEDVEVEEGSKVA
jgi:hypothetical protein